MFPIFLWVEEYKGFKNFQINIDKRYSCKLEYEIIPNMERKRRKKRKNTWQSDTEIYYEDTIILKNFFIKKNKGNLENFYGKHIDSVNLIIGQNGAGKTSILEQLAKEHSKKNINYFILYKIDESQNYLIEGNVKDYDLSPIEKYKFIIGNPYMSQPAFSYIIDKDCNYIEYPNHIEKYSKINEKTSIGLIKYKLNITNSKENINSDNYYRRNSRPSKYQYSYDECLYSSIFEFLINLESIGISIKNNYKNAALKLVFKPDKRSFSDINKIIKINKENYEIDSNSICDKIIKKFDITKNIEEKIANEKIIRTFCNRSYFSILIDAFEEKYNNDESIQNHILEELGETYEQRTYIKEYILDILSEIHSSMLKIYTTKSLFRLLHQLLQYYSNINTSLYHKEFVKIYRQIRRMNLFTESNIEIFNESSKNTTDILKLLEIYDSSAKKNYYSNGENVNPEIFNFFEIKIVGCSDGEEANLKLFSSIDWFLKADCYNKKYITLLLDEPDIFLHPELNRKLFMKLLQLFESYKEKRFKIIISSHSPFLLSDVDNKDAIFLGLNSNENPLIVENINRKTFGANIMELYKDSFFMESTFGEFAKNKIQKIVEELTNKKEDISEERKYEIWETIQMIGEKLVRKKLENMYYEYFEIREEKRELERLIEEKGLSKDDITKLIEQIKGI